MNYLEFGIFENNKKKKYEVLKGNLYDYYMLSRYFNDIYLANKYNSIDKIHKIFKKIHDVKDLKFNLISFILLSLRPKVFYEFGFSLLEKIAYFKLFNNIVPKNLKITRLDKIIYSGNDISNKFIFFSKNFFQNYKLKLTKKLNTKNLKNSVFYSKGVSLLYEKENLICLKKIIHNSYCGSFDMSVHLKKKFIKKLNTGYKMYYPFIDDFKKVLKSSKKNFIFRNIKKKKNLIYFETVFGNKKLLNKFTKSYYNLDNYLKYKKIPNIFKTNIKFKNSIFF